MKTTITALLLMLCLNPVAVLADAAQGAAPKICPNPKALRGLCMFVGNMTNDEDHKGRYRWRYQQKLIEAACVDITVDSEEEIGRKIAKVWKDNEDTLICNNTSFDVSNGNLIKFAVNVKFDEFILDIAAWGVELNKVDSTDGRTVLDYVSDSIRDNRGLPVERNLRHYYDVLRKAGAKHRSEL